MNICVTKLRLFHNADPHDAHGVCIAPCHSCIMLHSDAFEAAQVEDCIIFPFLHDPDDGRGLRLILTLFCLRARSNVRVRWIPAATYKGPHPEEAKSFLVEVKLPAHGTLAEVHALHLSLHAKP
jgi:hypothetical protein